MAITIDVKKVQWFSGGEYIRIAATPFGNVFITNYEPGVFRVTFSGVYVSMDVDLHSEQQAKEWFDGWYSTSVVQAIEVRGI